MIGTLWCFVVVFVLLGLVGVSSIQMCMSRYPEA